MDPMVGPLGMISGNPSFQGGDSGPAFSEASSSATQASPFNVYGSGTDTSKALMWGAIVIIAVGALWVAANK